MKLAQPWRFAFPLIILTILALLGLFYDTVHSMVLIWRDYGTFTHGFLIAPVSAWLIWQRRAELAVVTPRPHWLGLLAFASIVFIWLLGDLGEAQVVRHYTFVAMIPLAVFTLAGWQATRVMLVPLLFLLLAVPFGDAFIDPLIVWTTNFTVAGLHLFGVPVFREGNMLTLPTGQWSVVAACSGLRYLVASVTLGLVYAYLTYRSFWRRALFVLASIIVPIFANGARALMIVMIGHLSNMKYAVGVDHLIYGWLFFGLVMFLLFWVGSFWREDEQPAPIPRQPAIERAPAVESPSKFLAYTALLLIVAGAAPAYSAFVARTMASQPPAVLKTMNIAGWQPAPLFTFWRPQFKNPAAEQMTFLSHQNQQAGLYIGYYRNQNRESELIAFGNVLAMPGGAEWHRLGDSTRELAVGNEKLTVQQNQLANHEQRLLAWYWYWTGDRFTPSSYVAKASLALNRLLVRRDDGAVIVVFAPYTDRPDTAAVTLQQLVQAALPQIRQTLQEARAH